MHPLAQRIFEGIYTAWRCAGCELRVSFSADPGIYGFFDLDPDSVGGLLFLRHGPVKINNPNRFIGGRQYKS